MTAIDQERCTDHPLPPVRRRWGRIVFEHDERRRGRQCRWHDLRRLVAHHLQGDLQRARDCYVGATVLPFAGIFGSLIGDPNLVPPCQARVISFPRRAINELAELRVEIEQMRRTLSVR